MSWDSPRAGGDVACVRERDLREEPELRAWKNTQGQQKQANEFDKAGFGLSFHDGFAIG